MNKLATILLTATLIGVLAFIMPLWAALMFDSMTFAIDSWRELKSTWCR